MTEEFVNIIKNYENLDEYELKDKLEEINNKWNINEDDNIQKIMTIVMNNMNLNEMTTLTKKDIEKEYQKVLYDITTLHMIFCKKEIINNEDMEYNNYLFIFSKIFECIYYSYKLLQSLYKIKNTSLQENELNMEIGLSRFTPIDYNNNTPYQNLILYLLEKIYDMGYMRYGDFCYSRVYNDKGEFTYSWEQKVDIEKFVYDSTQKEQQFEQWKNLTKDKGNLKAACIYLQTCVDPQFRDLKKDRHVFSFRNGVYISKRQDNFEDYFYKYSDIPQLDPKTIACKYFDVEFNNYENIPKWYDIPTKYFQSILDYQFKDNEDYNDICKWIYILIGRLIYNAGEYDDWQVMPYIRGTAGTGKSSIITQVIQKFYDVNDVGILSNDMEKTFGLSGLCDKYIFIGPEIKKNFSLSQALLQSMISAEEVSVPIKHKMAEGLKWVIPGIMAGNEIPNYQDSAGSISRRFVIIDFKKKVKEKDSNPLLKDNLKIEIPALIKKCNVAYLESVKKYGEKNIWAILPKYFQETREKLKEQTNYMQHFLLKSDKVSCGEGNYCSEKVFREEFINHCKLYNFPKIKFSNDLYELPFMEMSEKYGIEVCLDRRKLEYPKGSKEFKKSNYIIGINMNIEDEVVEE